MEISNNIDNYFHIYNLTGCYSIKENFIFKFYLNYFFDKNKNVKYQVALINQMIQRIKENNNGIQLEANVILKFFKICSNLKLN